MKQIVSNCPKCGAPIYVKSPWWSILPAPNEFSCNCFPQPEIYTSTSTKMEYKGKTY